MGISLEVCLLPIPQTHCARYRNRTGEHARFLQIPCITPVSVITEREFLVGQNGPDSVSAIDANEVTHTEGCAYRQVANPGVSSFNQDASKFRALANLQLARILPGANHERASIICLPATSL